MTLCFKWLDSLLCVLIVGCAIDGQSQESIELLHRMEIREIWKWSHLEMVMMMMRITLYLSWMEEKNRLVKYLVCILNVLTLLLYCYTLIGFSDSHKIKVQFSDCPLGILYNNCHLKGDVVSFTFRRLFFLKTNLVSIVSFINFVKVQPWGGIEPKTTCSAGKCASHYTTAAPIGDVVHGLYTLDLTALGGWCGK